MTGQEQREVLEKSAQLTLQLQEELLKLAKDIAKFEKSYPKYDKPQEKIGKDYYKAYDYVRYTRHKIYLIAFELGFTDF